MSLRVDLLDSRFLLRGPEPLLASVADFVAVGTPDDSALEVDLGDDDLTDVLTLLNMTALAQCRSFAVHAGVVAGAGGAVALPATSGAGKSTLVAACLRAGLGYVSDEALVTDWDTGEVRAYPKWLSLSPWSAAHVGLKAGIAEKAYPAALLGTVAEPTRLAHVVLPVRRPGPATLEPASRAAAAHCLLEMSFNHYQQPPRAFALVADLLRGAQAWQLSYAEATEGAHLLAAHLGDCPDTTAARGTA